MLVLSRRESEKVLFPELGITLEIVRIKGNIVRVGIDAPRSIRVIRGELQNLEQSSDPVSYSNEPTAGSVVAESSNPYQLNRNPVDLAVAAANDVIAC